VLSDLTMPVQIVVICGKNEKLRQSVQEQLNQRPESAAHLDFKVLGYTTKMDEWMKSADLYIGKPGGLTTAEAMSCGLPMVIYQPIPGQEERNSDFLLENGAAVKCNQLATMAYKVDLLLKDPERMAKMRRRALGLSHPDAARQIVQKLIDEFYTEAVTIPQESPGKKAKQKLRLLGRKLLLSGEEPSSVFKSPF
jgi:processive 1,2-diacylglycerol beta-glucosyltransferase